MSNTDEKNKVTNSGHPSGIGRQDIDKADSDILLAFALLGLVSEDSTLICPHCGTDKRKKVEVKKSAASGRPYWTCHKCSTWGSSAVDILKQYGSRTFTQAVRELLGQAAKGASAVVRPDINIAEGFSAIVDVEVYNYIRNAGSVQAACDYYAQWHITPQAVREAGSTMILDAPGLQQDLLKTFGEERLRLCGVTTLDKNNKTIYLVSSDYSVVEPHQAPSGNGVGMQFRPGYTRMKQVKAHKDWKALWSGHLDAQGVEIDATTAWADAYALDRSVGRKAPYVTSFLSLRGGTPDHLVGCGLERLVALPAMTKVYVVEGFKDLLAARSMGVESYAIPGTGVMPPDRSIEILRKHDVIVVLDGDKAGASGREHLVSYLRERGVTCKPYEKVREGMDIADILVERHARNKCTCPTCSDWNAKHPVTI